jgi:hypothetical protein
MDAEQDDHETARTHAFNEPAQTSGDRAAGGT